MKKHPFAILFALLVALSLACSAVAPAPTETPTNAPTNAPTETPPPTATSTSTPKPTSTPRPTSTPVPPTATPASVGETVSNADYDVNVVKVRKLGSVYLDEYTVWQAKPGYLFLEIGVYVVNKKSSAGSVKWEDIYVTEANGDSWRPEWAGYKSVKVGDQMNPWSIIFKEITKGNADEVISFPQAAYFRLIWVIADHNPSVVNFGFDTSPLIQVIID
ncbi:MAG: hypothetical protein LC099_04450 [Anaerolineales bacterium]|nr:hypothetical protein [Anaerolineales bacterium]